MGWTWTTFPQQRVVARVLAACLFVCLLKDRKKLITFSASWGRCHHYLHYHHGLHHQHLQHHVIIIVVTMVIDIFVTDILIALGFCHHDRMSFWVVVFGRRHGPFCHSVFNKHEPRVVSRTLFSRNNRSSSQCAPSVNSNPTVTAQFTVQKYRKSIRGIQLAQPGKNFRGKYRREANEVMERNIWHCLLNFKLSYNWKIYESK